MASLTGVSTEQDGNSGTLDFVFRVAKGGIGRVYLAVRLRDPRLRIPALA